MADTAPTPPTSTPTSDDDFDQLIEEANLPEQPVPLCLHGTLRRQHEEVKARVDERAAQRDAQRTAAAAAAAGMTDVRLGSKTPDPTAADDRDPEQDLLDELVAKMRAKTIVFLIRALSGTEYQKLAAKHPPRRDPATGRVDPRDYQGCNSATFFPALVRACIVAPTMNNDRWAWLDAKLTDAQFDKLAHAAANVNRRDEDLPF